MSDPKNHEVHYILEGGGRYYFCDAVVDCPIHPPMNIEMLYKMWRTDEKQTKYLDAQLSAAQDAIRSMQKREEKLKTALACSVAIFKKFNVGIDGLIDDHARDQILTIFEIEQKP